MILGIKGIIRGLVKNEGRLRKEIAQFYYYVNKNKIKNKGKKNVIVRNEVFLKNVCIEIRGNNNHIFFGKGTILTKCNIVISGSNHKLIIGDLCNLNNSTFWFEDEDCVIDIGKNTTIGEAHIAVTEPNSKIKLGNDCMLSTQIDIRCGDSHSIIDLHTNKRVNYAKNITIGDHVWIGANSQILKGVEVGSNTIIGIRSVLTKNIPGNCVAAGVPAISIRENITWDRKRLYLKE